VLWSPQMAVAGYLALGLVVLASRLLFPKPKPAAGEAVLETPAAQGAPANCEQPTELPLAA
jgi:hypothetical protein